MKQYFYCQSYQAFNLAIAMSLHEDITVITAVDNIVNACRDLNVKFIKHKPFSKSEMLRQKKEVDIEIDILMVSIGDSELHFSHTQIAVFSFYLVKRLNDNKQKTVFHNFEFVYNKPSFSSIFKKSYWKPILYCKAIKIRYNLPIRIRMASSKSFMLSLDLSYISNKCFSVVNNKDNYFDITFDLFKNHNFKLPEIENLFIAQTFTDFNFFNQESINCLLPVLNSSRVYVKNHPKLGKVKGLEGCITLPDYLPVEFYFKKVRKNIISFHSGSLITASKFENCHTLSLLDIVKIEDPFLEKVKNELLAKSNKIILFPASVNELNELLYNN